MVRILRYIKGSPGKGIIYENRGHIDLAIVYSLEGISFLGKARNKVMLLDQVLKQNIEQWLLPRVNLFG